MKSKVLWLSGSTGLGQLITALIFILAARAVTPANFGLISTVVALGFVLASFSDLGLNTFLIRELASDEVSIETISHRLLMKQIYVSTVGIFFIFCFMLFNNDYILSILLALISLLSQSVQVVPRALRAFGLVSIANLADRITALASFGIFNLFKVDVLDGLVLSLIFGNIAGITIISATKYRLRLSPLKLINPWKGSFHFGVSAIAFSFQWMEIPVLAQVAGDASAGIYGAVNRWTQPLLLFVSSYSSASAPLIAAASSSKKAWLQIKKGVWWVFLTIFMSVIAIIFAPVLVSLTLGSAYEKAVPVLQILSVVTILLALIQPVTVFLQSRGDEKFIGMMFLLAAFIQLALLFFLGGIFGAVGAALASLICQFIVCCLLCARIFHYVTK